MVVGRECLAANTGWLAARQRSGSGGLFQMILVNLLPLVQFVFITLLLPELADGTRHLACHGVVTVTATHQVLPQPAIYLTLDTAAVGHPSGSVAPHSTFAARCLLSPRVLSIRTESV